MKNAEYISSMRKTVYIFSLTLIILRKSNQSTFSSLELSDKKECSRQKSNKKRGARIGWGESG